MHEEALKLACEAPFLAPRHRLQLLGQIPPIQKSGPMVTQRPGLLTQPLVVVAFYLVRFAGRLRLHDFLRLSQPRTAREFTFHLPSSAARAALVPAIRPNTEPDIRPVPPG